jgi:hypothetical protein
MLQSLEANPDQTAMALLVEFRARYPEHYSLRQLCTLERRVRAWRRETIRSLATPVVRAAASKTAMPRRGIDLAAISTSGAGPSAPSSRRGKTPGP